MPRVTTTGLTFTVHCQPHGHQVLADDHPLHDHPQVRLHIADEQGRSLGMFPMAGGVALTLGRALEREAERALSLLDEREQFDD